MNQVTTTISDRKSEVMGRVNMTLALGLSWSNCVNTRQYLTRSEITVRTERDKDSLKPIMGQSTDVTNISNCIIQMVALKNYKRKIMLSLHEKFSFNGTYTYHNLLNLNQL